MVFPINSRHFFHHSNGSDIRFFLSIPSIPGSTNCAQTVANSYRKLSNIQLRIRYFFSIPPIARVLENNLLLANFSEISLISSNSIATPYPSLSRITIAEYSFGNVLISLAPFCVDAKYSLISSSIPIAYSSSKVFNTVFATPYANSGGTAFPICLNASPIEQSKKKSSGKDCNLAASLTVIPLGSIG